jgi:hypothetical protein
MAARKKIPGKRAGAGPSPAGRADPKGIKPERVDPSPRAPIVEPESTDLEGQEGVGPGPRDAIRREEQGPADPEEDA